jgi:glucuronate isomerase
MLMMTSETFKERFKDALSIRLNGVRYCGKRLQTDGVELYVLTGDYNPVYKQYMEYMAMIHTPTGNLNIVSMEENGKLFPWITPTMAKRIEEFKLTIKKG